MNFVLSKNQIEILDHTFHRAPKQMFCGSSADMDYLCGQGLMKYAFELSYVPDKYYTITRKGRLALSESKAA